MHTCAGPSCCFRCHMFPSCRASYLEVVLFLSSILHLLPVMVLYSFCFSMSARIVASSSAFALPSVLNSPSSFMRFLLSPVTCACTCMPHYQLPSLVQTFKKKSLGLIHSVSFPLRFATTFLLAMLPLLYTRCCRSLHKLWCGYDCFYRVDFFDLVTSRYSPAIPCGARLPHWSFQCCQRASARPLAKRLPRTLGSCFGEFKLSGLFPLTVSTASKPSSSLLPCRFRSCFWNCKLSGLCPLFFSATSNP